MWREAGNNAVANIFNCNVRSAQRTGLCKAYYCGNVGLIEQQLGEAQQSPPPIPLPPRWRQPFQWREQTPCRSPC